MKKYKIQNDPNKINEGKKRNKTAISLHRININEVSELGKHWDLILEFARVITNNHPQYEDLTQDIFFKIHSYLERNKGKEINGGFIAVCIRNSFLNLVKKEQNNRRKTISYEEYTTELNATEEFYNLANSPSLDSYCDHTNHQLNPHWLDLEHFPNQEVADLVNDTVNENYYKGFEEITDFDLQNDTKVIEDYICGVANSIEIENLQMEIDWQNIKMEEGMLKEDKLSKINQIIRTASFDKKNEWKNEVIDYVLTSSNLSEATRIMEQYSNLYEEKKLNYSKISRIYKEYVQMVKDLYFNTKPKKKYDDDIIIVNKGITMNYNQTEGKYKDRIDIIKHSYSDLPNGCMDVAARMKMIMEKMEAKRRREENGEDE